MLCLETAGKLKWMQHDIYFHRLGKMDGYIGYQQRGIWTYITSY